MYAQDFDETLPFMHYPDNLTSPRTAFNNYYCQNLGFRCSYNYADMLMPYVRNLRIFACPSDTTNWSNFDPNLARLSYGLNVYANTVHGGRLSARELGPGNNLSEIPRPADRIFMTEASNGLDSVGLWCFRSPSMNHQQDEQPCARKRGRILAVYFDGHAKVFRARGLLDQPPIRCNAQDPLCVQREYPEFAAWLP